MQCALQTNNRYVLVAQASFPNLAVLFDRQGQTDGQIFQTAVMYQPITLSTLVQATVMGRDSRETRFARHEVQTARPSPSGVYLSGLVHQMSPEGPQDTCVVDDIIHLDFQLGGRLVSEAQPVKWAFSQPAVEPVLTAHFNQTIASPDERSTHFTETFRILLSALSPCERMNSRKGILLIGGSSLPHQTIMDEVRIAVNHLLQRDSLKFMQIQIDSQPRLDVFLSIVISEQHRFPGYLQIPGELCN
jgi:hypothetical protein